MKEPIVLSFVQAEQLLAARQKGEQSIVISPDLGRSTITTTLTSEGLRFPDGERLSWQDVVKINKSHVNCFVVEEGSIKTIQVKMYYCSVPHISSMLIAGFTMHRIVDTDPMQDTQKKVATIVPIVGNVLDTATGLGYTAIAAARTAQHVVTIELDPGAQQVARLNPWSRELFDNPKIEQIMGDAFEVVPTFVDASFDRIIHDPPVFSLAGELYSGVFYQQLFRVLKKGGRLFHYIGDLNSKSSGTVSKGVLRRLHEAGFTRVVRRPEVYGIVAYK